MTFEEWWDGYEKRHLYVSVVRAAYQSGACNILDYLYQLWYRKRWDEKRGPLTANGLWAEVSTAHDTRLREAVAAERERWREALRRTENHFDTGPMEPDEHQAYLNSCALEVIEYIRNQVEADDG